MKSYRIVEDNFLGFEAQVKFSIFPFAWFQMHDYYWVNTFPTVEQAHHFIEKCKGGIKEASNSHYTIESHQEYEREVKLLLSKANKARRVIVWSEIDSDDTSRRSFFPRLFPANV